MKKILLAEDDIDFSEVLIQYLQLHNFNVVCAENGNKALEIFKNEPFDICILDVMMPEMDGFTLAEELLKINPDTRFIFLTAKQLKEDRIKGLQLGADDYVVKPFEAEELILRINNILKRSETNLSNPETDKILIGNYVFDTKRMYLKIGAKTQQLTEKEATLILFLFNNKNQIIKRETILNAIWNNNDYFSGRSMDVFITKIRKYFQDDSRITIESKRFIGLEFKINE
ncbi:response regulator transcription factor [Flavobacterium sp.]|uniref:response regulator transcription factor n=1 Tax=Flavobacterium sp. TaxID=239 RepID=UPI0026303E54|nr:response regulator transcription factor [Flavobacterium sp.]